MKEKTKLSWYFDPSYHYHLGLFCAIDYCSTSTTAEVIEISFAFYDNDMKGQT